MRRLLFTIALGAVALGGCAGRVRYTATASYSEPALTYVRPGVYAVEDVDEPMFYSDSYYWRLHGGIWYRSSYADRGWVYATPPRAVVTINQPYAYVRFHGNGRFHARRERIRDHRYYR